MPGACLAGMLMFGIDRRISLISLSSLSLFARSSVKIFSLFSDPYMSADVSHGETLLVFLIVFVCLCRYIFYLANKNSIWPW